MTDFSYLGGLVVTEETTARCVLHELSNSPTLILRPATGANKPYYAAMLRRSGKSVRNLARSGLTPEMIKDVRNSDRKLFPKHVIVGWENVLDTAGNEVPFSAEAASELCQALPDWVFDLVIEFAKDISNFVEDVIDVEETAKN